MPWDDVQSRCFLCSKGVMSVEAGEGGLRLFAELSRIVAQLWAVRSPGWLTALVLRFHRDWLLPLFTRAGVPPPEVEPAAVYEHLSTTEHSDHPLVYLVVTMRELRAEINDLKSSMRVVDGSSDPKILGQIANRRKMYTDLYLQFDLNKAAFRDSGLDGDIHPVVMKYITPATAILDLQHHLSVGVFDWLRAYAAGHAEADADG